MRPEVLEIIQQCYYEEGPDAFEANTFWMYSGDYDIADKIGALLQRSTAIGCRRADYTQPQVARTGVDRARYLSFPLWATPNTLSFVVRTLRLR